MQRCFIESKGCKKAQPSFSTLNCINEKNIFSVKVTYCILYTAVMERSKQRVRQMEEISLNGLSVCPVTG